jgi:hypothetical protein
MRPGAHRLRSLVRQASPSSALVLQPHRHGDDDKCPAVQNRLADVVAARIAILLEAIDKVSHQKANREAAAITEPLY